jgi:hypothetical protein
MVNLEDAKEQSSDAAVRLARATSTRIRSIGSASPDESDSRIFMLFGRIFYYFPAKRTVMSFAAAALADDPTLLVALVPSNVVMQDDFPKSHQRRHLYLSSRSSCRPLATSSCLRSGPICARRPVQKLYLEIVFLCIAERIVEVKFVSEEARCEEIASV